MPPQNTTFLIAVFPKKGFLKECGYSSVTLLTKIPLP
uniref:Uncharacterized protein n=2 Tax=unclassified Caudoviricetes TaxID=2788787 RepID=A0A8S5QKS4_9CAUD|nr:MAG TPA: hypothetical protein [Siphoviridae sp. ctVii20]DAE19389.1 MAG TPA: hypothetical protein [Siphoviridae sp. ctezl47]